MSAKIATGVIKATTAKNFPYTVSLPVGEDKKRRMNFFVDNSNDMSYYMRVAMECGESVAGVFSFSEQDQFAHYIPDDKITISE